MNTISYIVASLYRILKKTEGRVFVNYPRLLYSLDDRKDRENTKSAFFNTTTGGIYLRNLKFAPLSEVIIIINHETIHYVLMKRVSYDSCLKFDNFELGKQIEYNLV